MVVFDLSRDRYRGHCTSNVVCLPALAPSAENIMTDESPKSAVMGG